MAYQGNHPLPEEKLHNPHVQSMLHKHAQKDAEIRELLANPAASDAEIKKLKWERLMLMDEIARQATH